MKTILFSLALIMMPLVGDEIEIIESIPLDDMSDIHLDPVSPSTTQANMTSIPIDVPPREVSPLVVQPQSIAPEPEKWVNTLGGIHDSVVTKKSYLKGILAGQQYGEYAIAQLVSANLVKKFYRKDGYKTVWISSGFDINPNLFEMVEMIRGAENEGLKSETYHFSEITAILEQIKNDTGFSDKERTLAVTQVDVLLTDAFLTMAKDLREGEMNFSKFRQILNKKSAEDDINYKWDAPNRSINYVSLLRKVSASGGLENTLLALSNNNELYMQLKEAYKRYVDIVAQGGWQKIPKGEQLRKGVISKRRVPLLAHRLYMSGDLDFYDPNITIVTQEMKDAIKHFQKRMGIWPSGAVTESTRNTMNVSAQRRLDKIKLNLERMRWEKEPFGLEYVLINIPDFKMRFYKDGGKDVEMRVVVGKKSNPTPIFNSTLSYMVLNPTWSVPKSIVLDEMLPRIQEDPEYLAAHKFKLYQGWKSGREEIDAFSVDWWQYDEESHLPYSFVRQPGPGNPLGLVKFMFPNKYAVYMHDTPDKKLFKNSRRAYSHGCIRLHKPQELLSYLCDNFTDSSFETVERMQNSGKTQSVRLRHGVPVHVRYYTAWMEDDGAVNFRNDIYGYDGIQYNLLRN